jgi:tape measure domain-containing protein
MARMSMETAIQISAEVKGGGNIDRVKRSLQELGQAAQVTKREKTALRTATLQLARANDGTIAGIRTSVAALRGLQEQAKIGGREFQKYGAEIQRLEGKLRGLDGTASQTNTRIAGMAAVAGRLIAAYAGIEAVRFVFGNAAELESQTRSLEVLTGSAERAKDIVQQLQQLGAVTPFTSTELIDTAKRLQAFGIETEKVVDITRRLADVSGATGAELGGLATAYGQVQAKGRLQGEELLQFQERGVALQQVLRKEYGLTGIEFQKALEKGQISAEAVEFALIKLTDSGGKYANGAIAQSDTLRGRMSTLTDSVQVLAQTIGKTLEPVFKWALTQATAVVSEIQRLIDEANNTDGARDREAQFARNANAAVRAMGLNPLTQQGMMAEMRQRNIEQQRADYRLRQQTERASAMPGVPPAPVIPPLTGGATGGAGAGGGRSGSGPSIEDRIAARPFGRQIIAAAQANGIDPALFAALVEQESGNRQTAISRSGAIGLAQLMPGTARELGVNPRDPMQNLMGGARYLRQQMDRFGLEGGLRAYNQGPGAQQRTPGGNSQESREYPGRVLARYRGLVGSDGKLEEMQAQGFEAQQQAAEQLEQRQQAATQQLEEFVETRIQSIAKLNEESELLQATTDIDRRRLEYAFEQSAIQDRAKEAERDFMKMQEELNALGIEYNAEQQLARIESEKQQALTNARIKSEQEINDLMIERSRMVQGVTQQVVAPTAFNELETQNAALDEILEKYPAIGQAADAAANLATRGFAEMVTGAKSAKEVFVEFLNGIAEALIDTAKRMIAQYIAIGIAKAFAGLGSSAAGGFSGASGGASSGLSFDAAGMAGGSGIDLSFPATLGRALGGGVSAGRPYPVGENGPELFVPYQAGTIIPAEATEALQSINSASLRGLSVPFQAAAPTAGTSSQQGSAAASTSGLSVPFQRGMEGLSVPFQRGGIDGGMGAAGMGGGGGDSTIRFESVVINNQEFVTRQEAEAIGRRSEKRGAALAHKRNVNNVTIRRQAGFS